MMNEHPKNPLLDRLNAALKALEEFTKLNENSKANTPLNKAKRLVLSIIQHFSKKNMSQHILSSVETLQRHSLILKQMQKGSEKEKSWAFWAIDIINRYNHFIDQAQTNPKSLSQKHKITIPEDPSFYFNSSRCFEEMIEEPETTTSSLFSRVFEPLSNQETDLFRMKTISLSVNSNLPDSLKSSIKSMIWNSPKHTLITNSPLEDGNRHTTLSVTQILNSLPGELIRIRGAFQRRQNSPVSSVPIQDSFQLTFVSSQSGFPKPCQHTGWSLSESLIPECLMNMECFTHLHRVLEKKKKIAHELLPQGVLNSTAKEKIKIKKELFENDLSKHLDAHMQLSLMICQTSSCICDDSKRILHFFYNRIGIASSPFTALSEINKDLNRIFFSKPLEMILNQYQTLFTNEPEIRKEICEKIIDETILQELSHLQKQSEEFLDYLSLMGKILGKTGKSIILQTISEKIGFKPTKLCPFEKSMQTVLYHQLISFHKELENPQNNLRDSLLRQIDSEIMIFQQMEVESEAASIVRELDTYFSFAKPAFLTNIE